MSLDTQDKDTQTSKTTAASPDNDPSYQDTKSLLKDSAKGLIEEVVDFVSSLLNIRQETDKDQTIEDIKKDIPFRGHTAWILIFSVFIASIGLNVSSTAIVIGAMLISPLMAPIIGIGLSLAINDLYTLRRSVSNLLVMVLLSVFTAFMYFTISPLTALTPELESRTEPTILDVFVAIFGGLALIVAKSKKGTMPNAISGVAIATALMPPLCTVGYGLSVWDSNVFLGAIYLFSINTIFIALSTFVVVKILRFPMLRYATAQKRKKMGRIVMLIAISAMIPAIISFVSILDKTRAEQDFRRFITKEVETNDGLYLRRKVFDYTEKKIKLFFHGEITQATRKDLRNEITDYTYLEDFELLIVGNKSRGIDELSKVFDQVVLDKDRLREEKQALEERVVSMREQIKALESKLDKSIQSSRYIQNNTRNAFEIIIRDAKIQYPNIMALKYGRLLRSDFTKTDSVTAFIATWGDSITTIKEKDSLDAVFRDWVKAKQMISEDFVVR